MILEPNLIQQRGFHNLVENGKTIGFQFNIRLTYYRGIFLSQLRQQSVTVDGERFSKEEVLWHIKGRDITVDQMREETMIHWSPEEPASLKIMKLGGLSAGYHEITTGYKFSSSYIPPVLQMHLDEEEPEPLFEVLGFGKQHETRRLILV